MGLGAFAAELLIALLTAVLAGLVISRRALARATVALNQSEADKLATFSALPDLIFIMNRDGVYLDCHTRDLKALLVPPEQFLGRRMRDVLPPPLVPRMEHAFEAALASNATVLVEYSLDIQGEPRDFEARLVRWEGDRVLSIIREISERKRFERALSENELALRASMVENHALIGRLIAAQELERQRIARDLHDDLSQKLALLAIRIDRLSERDALDGDRLESRIRSLAQAVAEIATDVHNLSHELHPSKLETLGFVEAVRGLCRETRRLSGIAVDFRHSGASTIVDTHVSLHLYRIVQEGLHNVSKHSGASQALVELVTGPDAIDLRIADSGCGFDESDSTTGLGLVNIRERVRLLEGQMVIHSAPNEGTRLGVRVPLSGPGGPAWLQDRQAAPQSA